jgi:hypothetical protein
MNSLAAIRSAACRWTWLCVVWFASLAAGQTPAPLHSDSHSSLSFRRIFAPADRIDDWPRGKLRYVPVEPQEFERLVDAAKKAPEGATTSSAARLVQAHYDMKLTASELLTGRATWEITHPGQTASLMPLDSLGLAVTNADWQDSPLIPTIGLAADGRSAVLVEKPGKLLVDWSLRGQRDSADAVNFQLALPCCPNNTLLVDLPAEMVLLTSRGVIDLEPMPPVGRRVWRVTAGGQHRLGLRIVPESATSEHRRLTLLRESLSTYEFSPRSVELTTQFDLEVLHEPLQRLELSVDAGLQLVAARYGEATIPWSSSQDPKTGATRVSLELPEPILGAGRPLRLAAIAPLVEGHKWRLPGIHVPGAFWQEGNLRMLIPAPLQLDELSPLHCRQSKTGPLPAPLQGQSLELQCDSADATTEVLLAHRRERFHLSSGTLLNLESGQVRGQMLADLQLPAGERFTVQADVSEGWSIDSVESVPAGVVADWRLSNTKHLLSIRLHRALRSDRPLRLLVSGRRLSSPLGKTLRAASLRMLEFRDTQVDKKLLCLRTAGNYQVRMVDADDVPRLDLQHLPHSQRELFAETPRGIVVEFDPVSARWGVALERQSPRYSAEVRVDASATSGPLIESYAIRCLPEATRIEQVQVHFSQTREEPPRWSLANSPSGAGTTPGAASVAVVGEVTARRLPKDPQASADAGGETWEVTLRHPRTAPFELRATRTTAWNDDIAVSLASLPEAVAQQGRLVVHAAADTPLTISNAGLQAVPVEAARDHQFTNARAAFRYESPDDASPVSNMGVRLSRPRDALRESGALIWTCQVESRLGSDGRGLHTATYHVQNAGRSQCSISLAPDARLLELWVDDQRLTPRAADAKEAITVPLPAGKKFPTIVAQYLTESPAWETLAHWEAALPGSELPILSRRWTLWLPAGFEMLAPAASWQALDARPLTWSQRILGPLGRPSSEQPFRPASVDIWSHSLADEEIDANSLDSAQEFLTRLGTAVTATNPPGETLEWGALLSRVDSAGESGRRLLVDTSALTEAGVLPHTAVRLNNQTKASARERGAAVLTQANLLLLVDEDALLLTTSMAAKFQQSQLTPLESPALRWVRKGPITTQIRAGLGGQSAHCSPLKKWLAHARSVWTAGPTSAVTAELNNGWTAYRWEGSRDELLQIRVVQSAALQSTAWGIFWLVLALSWWRLRHSPKWLVGGACLFAIMACWVPDRFSPLASAAVLGSLAVLALRWLDPRPDISQDKGRSPLSKLSRVETAIPVVLLLALLFAVTRQRDTLRAAEPPTTLPLEVHSVFIPIDAEGKPTGERYMVPESLHSALRRLSTTAAEAPLGSLILGAEYRVVLVPDGNDPRASAAQCTARFEVRVLSPGAKIRLPLGRAAANLVPDTALLDRRPIEVAWDEEGRVLECEAQDVGHYHLELTLRPAVQVTGDFRGFDVPIPPVPKATLEIPLSAQSPLIEVPLALGQIERTADKPARLLAQLGPTERLVVRWSDIANGRGAELLADVEELLWLKVRPGSVVLDAHCKVRMLEGQMRELRFAVDPRLRLLPWEAQNSAISEIRTETAPADAPGSPHTLHCKLARPLTDQATVSFSFLWTGASGVGNLRVPLLEARDGRATRRWLAVSVDPALEFEAAQDKQLVPLAIPEFSAQWGPATAPQIAFQLPRGDVRWSLATRPRQPHTTAQQTLALSFQHGRASVNFDARLNTTAGYVFQHRLRAPIELEVDSISIVEDGAQRVARWASDPSGLITIFLTGPVAGPQELTLRGRLPAPLSGKIPLSRIQIEQAEIVEDTVHLYRRPAVLLSVENVEGWIEAAEPARVEGQKDLGRLVKSFSGSGEKRSASLKIEPNHPRTHVTQIATLTKEANAWELTCECRCQVEQGLQDEFRWHIPTTWVGPFEVIPQAAHEVIEVAGDSLRQLVIRPRSAVQGEYKFTVRGAAEFPPGERIAAPSITPLGMLAMQRFLVLPTQVGLQQVAWQTAHLKPSALPKGIDQPAEGLRAYRVTGANPQALLKTVARAGSPAQVMLADVHLLWHAEGTCHGLVNFDLDPAGLTSCVVRLPPECDLVQASVAGLSITPLRVAVGEWRLPLSGGSLPVRVQAIYKGQLTPSSTPWGERMASLPVLTDLPIEQTLVTFYGPPGSRPVDAAVKDRTSDVQADLLRYEVIASISDLPTDLAAEQRTEDLAGWYQPWARRSQALRVAVREQLSFQRPDEKTQPLQSRLNAVEQKQRQTAQRLGISLTAETSAGAVLPHELAEDFVQHTFAGEHRVRRYHFAASTTPAELSVGRTVNDDWFQRFSWSATLLGAACILVVAGRRGILDDWSRRWPHALGVMAGVAWWLWLTPSVLGWILIIGSLLASMRPAWRGTRESASAVKSRS